MTICMRWMTFSVSQQFVMFDLTILITWNIWVTPCLIVINCGKTLKHNCSPFWHVFVIFFEHSFADQSFSFYPTWLHAYHFLCYHFVFFSKRWKDYQLTWDEAEYGGISVLRLPADKVWKPDIVLFNKYVFFIIL